MATYNFLVKYFIHDRQEKLQALNLKFCHPIFLDQTVRIHSDHERFELIDANEKLLAFGSRKQSA